MLTLLAQTTLRTASRFAPRAAPVAAKAVSARFASRFMSEKPFAVDAPDGEHDLQDIEESSTWAKRTVDLASVTEDTKTINEIHDAVLGKQMFAVDAPDGEHDLEDVEEHMEGVKNIIDEASLFEDPDEVKTQQQFREENIKEANRMAQHDL
ncbi:hypothetical protein HJC23_009015 [Cyclotella cryptica]|uniref:Uncharacterized protein n=1 Tax=Cyclotella cryptica TaxID=29204 RepID=A0ABD3QXV6_9STRA|eukprot:CCRYP_000604-RA/>CCRYP_000604-RA protein AED:0.12 eAED:0.12 QI:146/1/1/1/1/1/3/171/151